MNEIRKRRDALGLTQLDLARRAGVSIAMLRMLDNGYRPKRSLARDRVLDALSRAESARAER